MPQTTPAPTEDVAPEVLAAAAASELGAKTAAVTQQLSTAFAQLEDLQGLLRARSLENARAEVRAREQASSLEQREKQVADQLASLAAAEIELKSERGAIDQARGQLQKERDEFDANRQSIEGQRRKIEQAEQELARRQSEAADRQKTLDARHEELESFSREVSEKSRSAEHAVGQLEQQRGDIEQRRAELATEQERLRKQDEAVTSRMAELKRRDDEVTERHNRLAEDLESLSQFERTLQSTRTELADQEARIQAHEQELIRREAAMKQFQEAMKGIAAAFGGALPIDPATMAAVNMPSPRDIEPAPSIVPAHTAVPGISREPAAPAETGPDPERHSPSSGPTDARPLPQVVPERASEQSEPTSDADDRSTEAAPQRRAGDATVAAIEPEQPAAATPSAPPRPALAAAGDIDESRLSPDELKKLKVLRRLTGGRTTDAELLARIRHEAGGAAAAELPQQGSRKKRTWW
ncbi:Chromosome partition protein Smc [Phycisphaerae bacterium RAS1]|nr:Chromosome partition protein Smc [Phycisphaerae bacterium RAS1]